MSLSFNEVAGKKSRNRKKKMFDTVSNFLVGGDIVQVINHEDKMYMGCLFILTDVKPWGYDGYLLAPLEDKGIQQRVQMKFEFGKDEIAKVGHTDDWKPCIASDKNND